MALYKYFKKAEEAVDKVLPDPKGFLSAKVPSSSISKVNDAVKGILSDQVNNGTPSTKKRGPYILVKTEEKIQIARRAAENGIANTIRHYAKMFPNLDLKESSVRTWRNSYRLEIKKRVRCGEDNLTVSELPTKKRGRPLLLGEELEEQVRAYLTSLRENGAVVNTAILIACAEGIVKTKDCNLLACNGGHISLTKDWAKSLMGRMGLVKRRASTKAKVRPDDFEALKLQFLLDIKTVVEMDEIPLDLIINWDQTGINYVPVSSWTMANKGAKRIEIFGVDDKRQITAVFTCSMAGDFLPVQLIYMGKTLKCLPSFNFPSDWHITHTPNHWSNTETMDGYLEKILLPYVRKKKRRIAP